MAFDYTEIILVVEFIFVLIPIDTTGHHIRHLPILEGSNLIGMISSRDVIQVLIEEKERRLESLYERLEELR